MIRKLISLLLMLVTAGSCLYAQNATLNGRILSFRQEPLSNVSVTLLNTSIATITDESGSFKIVNIPPGSYSIVATSVGYTATTRSLVFTSGQSINLDLQLSENRQVLQEVFVSGSRNKYRQANTSLGTRTDARLIEIPQSAQVVGQQVIKDRQAYTLNEISTVMTGVKANNGMGAFSMRGFTGYNPFDAGFITFNGIRGNLYMWSQAPLLYNVDRVEVLRGPASVLFSESMPGGVINFVTKKPQADKQIELNATYGSWNMARISADATGAISKDKKLRYRAIGGFDRSNSFRNYQKIRNVFLAPSLAYHFTPNTSLNLDVIYAYASAVQQYDRGVFVKKLANGSYDFNYYPNHLTVHSPTDFGKTHNTSAAINFNHRFNDNLSFVAVQRYVRNQFRFADHVVSGAIIDDSINRSYEIWDYDQYNWQTTAFANYKAKTGRINHSLLLGVDYNNYGWTKNDYRNSTSKRMYIPAPDYSNDVPAAGPNDYYDDNKQAINLVGVYLQDQLSFGERLKLLLSLRHDSYNMVQTPLSSRDDLQGDRSTADAWIPRVGLVFQPVSNIAFYGNYNKSFNPQLSNSAGAGGPFPPRTAEQFEVGYKGDYFNNALSTTVSFYDIRYRNILAADPTAENPNRQAVVDGTRSKGFELTVQGNIRNISVIGGYAYNDHRLTSNSTIGKMGFRYVNAPYNIANLFLKYDVRKGRLNGLGFGLGGRYVSSQVGNLATQDFVVPESTVADAVINYQVRKFNVQLNVNNIADTRYFIGGLSRTTIAALGSPRNFRLSVNYTIF
ncbi:TonB-dependent receptor [Segetibacter sp. 3557_3]|uniref:TonB-dependent receptor n=1 Tax=Segetibacter sp. 3557_3 TaxID=2547429 RepID=UPI001058AEC8|nr:TonB-dependent receptor [Segetibacter sp. 3557_3]TDH23533.1 TonB-dependent receptor [Segetibacter sp. 3557_3]